MDVILLERVEKLGKVGDVVKVKPGYARNYLLPQKKALRANQANLDYFETQRASLEAANDERLQSASGVAGQLDGLTITLIRQASETGQLYGSASARDIAAEVVARGFEVERRMVRLDQPIKLLGLHPVRIALHPEVPVTVTVNVARSTEEAQLQIERGGAVLGPAEEDQAEESQQDPEGQPPAEAAGEAGAPDAAETPAS